MVGLRDKSKPSRWPMPSYSGIDLHSKSNHLAIIDENQKRISPKELANRKEVILSTLTSYREQIEGVW
jgi:hypothetical protein